MKFLPLVFSVLLLLPFQEGQATNLGMVLGACNTAYNGELRPEVTREAAIESCERTKKVYVAEGGMLPSCDSVFSRGDLSRQEKKELRAGCI